MVHPILPLLIAVAFSSTPAVDLHAKAKDPMTCLKADPALILIAADERDGPADGPDPHGKGPHDEIHDPDLPANQERDAHKAPKDPYGDQFPQGRAPY